MEGIAGVNGVDDGALAYLAVAGRMAAVAGRTAAMLGVSVVMGTSALGRLSGLVPNLADVAHGGVLPDGVAGLRGKCRCLWVKLLTLHTPERHKT